MPECPWRFSSIMAALFPYGRYALTPHLGIWATAGYGTGTLLSHPLVLLWSISPPPPLSLLAVTVAGEDLSTTTDPLAV